MSSIANAAAGTPADTDQTAAKEGGAARPVDTVAIGVYLIVAVLLLLYGLIAFWPEATSAAKPAEWNNGVRLFGWDATVSAELRLLWLVLLSGGLGAFVHAATSFSDYVGNRQFVNTWRWWYALRPFVGSVLALVVYMCVRGGGLLTAPTAVDGANPFGAAALGCLAGMFSKQATDKLNELFSTMFKTSPAQGDGARKDKLATGPKITSTEPPALAVGTTDVEVSLVGTGFDTGTSVRVNGEPRVAAVVNGKLTVKLLANDVAAPGSVSIVVTDSAGRSAGPFTLKVS